MTENNDDVPPGTPPRTVRLPGFLIEEEVGLGDVISRATHAFGFTPCGGCRRRAAALNRRVQLAPRSQAQSPSRAVRSRDVR
jgi:hypothetical protein